jgi:hypothetical protein
VTLLAHLMTAMGKCARQQTHWLRPRDRSKVEFDLTLCFQAIKNHECIDAPCGRSARLKWVARTKKREPIGASYGRNPELKSMTLLTPLMRIEHRYGDVCPSKTRSSPAQQIVTLLTHLLGAMGSALGSLVPSQRKTRPYWSLLWEYQISKKRAPIDAHLWR